MESILQQIINQDITPVFTNFFHAVTQPFIHCFQAFSPDFLPEMKSIFSNEPGLMGGMIFVLLSYSLILLIQHSQKIRVTSTNRKPSAVYREGFPSALKN